MSNINLSEAWILDGREIEELIQKLRNERYAETGIEPTYLILDNYTFACFTLYLSGRASKEIKNLEKLLFYEGLHVAVIADTQTERQVIEVA